MRTRATEDEKEEVKNWDNIKQNNCINFTIPVFEIL